MELVVLVDENGSPIGEYEKASVHGESTPRHLAFSCHLLDADGRVLMTRRALQKKTWPGVWTNAFCGHPQPGEAMEDAVRRRAAFELGVEIDDVVCVLPNFGYSAIDASGIEENEHCPVYIARAASALDPNPDEVAETQWTTADAMRVAVAAAPWAFSPWLVAHLDQLGPQIFREASVSVGAHA